MKKTSFSIVLLVSIFLASCGRSGDPTKGLCDEGRGAVLDGQKDPALCTLVIEPDIYVVLGARPFGYDNLSALVEVRSGRITRTVVVPATMELKTGDVVRVHLLCYRAYEESGSGLRPKTAKNACADVVIPYDQIH